MLTAVVMGIASGLLAFTVISSGNNHTKHPALYIFIYSTLGLLFSVCFSIYLVMAVILAAAILHKYGGKVRSSKRKAAIDGDLPFFLDFLVFQIEAGHSIIHSFLSSKMILQSNSPLREEILNFERDIQSGSYSSTEAIRLMKDRISTPLTKISLGAVVQALENGTPLGNVLLQQSERMRENQLIQGEQSANLLSVKLLFPLVMFIFPASFLVILSPVIVAILGSGVG